MFAADDAPAPRAAAICAAHKLGRRPPIACRRPSPSDASDPSVRELRIRPQAPPPAHSRDEPAHSDERADPFSAIRRTGPSNFDGLDFANWGAGPSSRHQRRRRARPTTSRRSTPRSASIDKSDRRPGGRLHLRHLHEPGQLRQPLRHGQLRRPGRALRHLRGPLGHHRLRVPARRRRQRVNPPGAFQCFAVSKTGDPVTGGWNFYSIEIAGGLDDYPKFGVWPDGIYMSANMFGYRRRRAVPERRASGRSTRPQMYAGAPTVQVVSFDAPGGDFTLLPEQRAPADRHAAAGHAELLRLDLALPERAHRLQVPRRLEQHLAVHLHRAGHAASPPRAGRTPRVPNAPSLGRQRARRAADPRDDAEPVHATSAASSRCGPRTPSAAATRTGFAAPRWYQVERHRRHRRARPSRRPRPGIRMAPT